MLRDRYDNPLTTTSQKAVEQYCEGVDRILSGGARMMDPFEVAVKEDAGFALGFCGLARAAVLSADMGAAKSAIAQAQSLSGGVSEREAAHINVMALLLAGKAAAALAAVRQHVDSFPRDVLIAQLATSVFGLIGFSGQPGREAELLAYTNRLLPHYGDDWWMLSQHAFSLCETGQLARAGQMIDCALAANPKSAHSAHIRSHEYYEEGNLADGIAYLEKWLPDYDRRALMHGHLSWHVALWALESGDMERMWRTVDADVRPNAAQGLPINVLTDTASILYRAEVAGANVAPERWKQVSDYAAKYFPVAGQSFIDMHAALAHAMAGQVDLLGQYISEEKGFAGDVVKHCADGFAAILRQDWGAASFALSKAMSDDARLGGSRAQRDLLDFAMVNVLLRQGKEKEAKLILNVRRPVLAHTLEQRV